MLASGRHGSVGVLSEALSRALSQAPVESVAPAACGFAELDDRVCAHTSGVVVARVSAARDLVAIAAHLARRAASAYASVVVAHGGSSASCWTEVGARLGLGRLGCDPTEVARAVAHGAAARDVLVIAYVGGGGWERAVCAELVALSAGSFVLLTTAALELPCDRFEIAPELTSSERQRWFSGLTADARERVPARELGALEAWWVTTRTFVPAEIVPSPAAESALRLLELAGRGLSVAQLACLGADPRVVGELERARLAVRDGEWVALVRPGPGPLGPTAGDPSTTVDASVPTDCDDADRVARMLLAEFPDDPWACARAAELELLAGRVDAADAVASRVAELADDVAVRRELVGRWAGCVEALGTADVRARLQASAAARALASGRAEEAFTWAKAAAASAPDDEHAALLLGRAAIAYGDLVTAEVVLERGRASSTGELAVAYGCELAEVAYRRGDLEQAFVRASAVLADGAAFSARLQARNTLGKLLLAQSRWDDAEAHFAEDALTAAAAHDKTAELRADVNRGIAMLSLGHLETARSAFEVVLHEGERLGDAQACAFALDNLTVVAIIRHEYGPALDLAERTFALRRGLGDRLTTAATVINITELRRKLGLFDHAEQSVAFGRRSLTAGMPKVHAARFGILRARIALDRGNAAEAEREVARLLPDAEALGYTEDLSTVHRLAARVALEDGDVVRARAWIDRARVDATTDEARAEVTLLAALAARADGRPDVALAQEAVRLARISHDEELIRQAHVLAAELLRGQGDEPGARRHVEQAAALCDRVVGSLTGDVRAAFLARPDVQAVLRLRDGLAAAELSPSFAPAQESCEVLPETQPRPGAHRPRADRPRADRPCADRPCADPTVRPAAVRHELVGDDPAIRGLHTAIRKIARTNSTVLIRGESGTGKELVAEAVHRASSRSTGPFVAVNCAALVETLLLSELFGHEKGAFTGAAARRRGRFEIAEGGTLFLDEIGDISPRTQVALLRVLQERTFERVGGSASIHADVRIICATHRDLKAMVERGEFREDLYYRLRGITLEIPPLRARMGDLPRIADHLLGRIACERGESPKLLSSEAYALLGRHVWHGNVRELENALRASSLFAEGDVISASDLADNVEDLKWLGAGTSPPPPVPCVAVPAPAAVSLGAGAADPTVVAYACVRSGSVSLSDLKRGIERDCIARALAETHGNITRAAALLGMKRPRMSQLVKQYGLAAVSTED